MATCPKGHTTTATDYCDECGAPLAARPAPASAGPAASGPASSGIAPPGTATPRPAAATTPGAGPDAQPCPECGTPRDGRFCEVCGHDFSLAAPSVPAPPSAAPAPPPQAPDPGPAADELPPATAGPAAAQAPSATATSPAARWSVAASADRAYYDRMRAAAQPDAEVVAFPAFYPPRRFELVGDQVLVGRRSRSRGVEPGIDLTGPPEDAGVSHAHALFVATADGSWSIVDLDSANGTYLNDRPDPVRPNEPVPLAVGDRVHVGAFTTLTVQGT